VLAPKHKQHESEEEYGTGVSVGITACRRPGVKWLAYTPSANSWKKCKTENSPDHRIINWYNVGKRRCRK